MSNFLPVNLDTYMKGRCFWKNKGSKLSQEEINELSIKLKFC